MNTNVQNPWAALPASHQKALQYLQQRGVSEADAAPAIFRLLWKAGVMVRPPHFVPAYRLAIGHALYFGIFWSSLMQIIHLVSPTIRAPGIIATVFAGVFFGVSMALIYALRKRRLQLADWQTVTTAST